MDRLKEMTPILKSLGADDLYMNLQENRLKTFRNWPFSGEIFYNTLKFHSTYNISVSKCLTMKLKFSKSDSLLLY